MLQMIAVIAMVIDHLAYFAPVASVYYIMKFIGRVAIVIMCYFVAEGFYKTENIGKYILRMAIFAAISQIPYYLYMRWGAIPQNFNTLVVDIFHNRNVIFTLLLGLILLTILKSDYNLVIKIIAIFATLRLSKYSDWSYWAILWVVGFGLLFGSKKKQIIWLIAVLVLRLILSAWQVMSVLLATKEISYDHIYSWLAGFGGFIAVLLLPLYNGRRGNAPKWLWYVFYPAHLLLLVALKALLFQ